MRNLFDTGEILTRLGFERVIGSAKLSISLQAHNMTPDFRALNEKVSYFKVLAL